MIDKPGRGQQSHTRDARTQTLAVVMRHHQAGRHADADTGYRRLIAARPADPDAWHLWGVLAAEQKQFDTALQRIEKALELKPREPVFLGNLGHVYLQMGEFAKAIDCYLECTQGRPEDKDTRAALALVCERQLDVGIAHQKAGRFAEAEACYRDVLRGQPHRADAWHLLGQIALERGEFRAAREDIARAIEIAPGVANYHNSLGSLHLRERRYAEAIMAFQHALDLEPGAQSATRNMGLALRAQYRFAEAETAFRSLLRLHPNDSLACNYLANVLEASGRRDDAEVFYRKALELSPDYEEAHYNLGILLRNTNRREEALASFQRAAELNAELPYVWGLIADARSRLCEWPDLEKTQHIVVDGIRQGKPHSSPFLFLTICDDASLQQRCAEIHVRSFAPPMTPSQLAADGREQDKIRLAYVSPDFRDHPVAFLIADLIDRHDRARFEVLGVSLGTKSSSPLRQRLEKGFDRFLDVHQLSDEAVVARLHEARIDIAVDLAGYTASSRPAIFAARVAPIQVNYLGFPGTLGASHIDYIVADRWVIPEHQRPSYTENVVYLPDTFQCGCHREIAERTPTRAQLGLPQTGFVFCCFNNIYKIQPELFRVWMRLLVRIPGSVLWLRRANDRAESNLRREAQALGVDPGRLIYADRVALPDHFARQRQADLFLDTLPYNAHTTASDALAAGLPVLTCLGNAFAGRVGASLLNAIGLPELVTPSLDAYEAVALRLATAPQDLVALRAKLQDNKRTYPLFDVDRFRRHIEAAYTTMWERHKAGDKPAAFAVDPTRVPSHVDAEISVHREGQQT